MPTATAGRSGSRGHNVAKLYIAKDGRNWALRFVDGGVFNLESDGHKSVREAMVYAKKWGHQVVTLTPKGEK